MENNNQQVTPEQYMLESLKRQIGERYAGYEEAIAHLQTRVAMMQQEIAELKEKAGDDEGADVAEDSESGA